MLPMGTRRSPQQLRSRRKPQLGAVLVMGQPVDAATVNKESLPYDDVRQDVVDRSPIPVTRLALRQLGPCWGGILDSQGAYFLFAMDGRQALHLRPTDATEAEGLYTSLADAERRHSTSDRRSAADAEMVAERSMLDGYGRPVLVDAGPQLAKGVIFERPTPIFVRPPPVAAEVDPTLETLAKNVQDDPHHIAYQRVDPRTGKMETIHARGWTPQPPQVFKKPTSGEAAEGGEDEEEAWSERKALAKPVLPKGYEPKGTKLIVNGAAVDTGPIVEQAAYVYAKRFLVRGGTVKDQHLWTANFEKSLRAVGLPEGPIDYKNFIERIAAEDAEPEEKVAAKRGPGIETPETHPHLFVEQDGQHVRCLAANIPSGGFYTGKDNYGAWVPPLREEDLTLNVSPDGVPPGWKGQVMHDPSKEFYMTWRNPVSSVKGYGYTSRMSKDLIKFHKAATLGSMLDGISDKVFKDITAGDDPKAKAAALCVLLIDQHCIRNGNEEFAKRGTFGIASLRAKHVKIEGTSVTFDFIAKKGERWVRTVDFAGMPTALQFLHSCVEGKQPEDRLWQSAKWRVDANDVNAYLKPFERDGIHPTAKTFRTFHANRHMTDYLRRLDEAQEAYGLTDKQIKMIYQGLKATDPLLRQRPKGQKKGVELAPFLGLVPHYPPKTGIDEEADESLATYGILPSVATKLGHTTGACRNSYLDPVVVVGYAARHGWDERTPSEKLMREDLAPAEDDGEAVEKAEPDAHHVAYQRTDPRTGKVQLIHALASEAVEVPYRLDSYQWSHNPALPIEQITRNDEPMTVAEAEAWLAEDQAMHEQAGGSPAYLADMERWWLAQGGSGKPIVAVRHPNDGTYEIVAGRHRYALSLKHGHSTINAIVGTRVHYYPRRQQGDVAAHVADLQNVFKGVGLEDLGKAEMPDPHHIAYQRTDPRTGKLEQIESKGWAPRKPDQEEKPAEEMPPLTLAGADKLHAEDLDSRHVYEKVAATGPKTRAEVTQAIKDLAAEYGKQKKPKKDHPQADLINYFRTEKPETLHDYAHALTQHFFDAGAMEEPEEDEDEEDEDHVAPWGVRQALARPVLRDAFPVKGTKIIVGDAEHDLTPEAEHAAYSYAKRFLVNGSGMKNQEKLKVAFEQSLRDLANLPTGDLHYDYFIRRIKKEDDEEQRRRKQPKPRETPQTHPHSFITQDGVPTRLMGSIPGGNFYTGKKGYGTWIPSIKEEDLTMNVSQGGAPPGWRGKVISDPTKDFYLTWTHPISQLQGYIYPSRVQADLHKFHKAATLGNMLGDISKRCHTDITGKNTDPSTRAAALCVMLIDQQHFRNGNEQYAKEGTFGISSIQAGHVKIDGTKVTFKFPAKKEEPWERTVDFAGMPTALAFINACLKNKQPTDRLWDGPDWQTTSADVNNYLAPFARDGVKPTAKVFRTFHANRYMHSMLGKLDEIKEAYGLKDGEIKALYKGIKEGSPQEATILDRKSAGSDVSLREAMGLIPYHGSKGDADRDTAIFGILPSVATKLGHTTGACRSNYLDPVNLAHFGMAHGWDERTGKEKKFRDDLEGLADKPEEAPIKQGEMNVQRKRSAHRYEIYDKKGALLDSTNDREEALDSLRLIPGVHSVFDAEDGSGHQYVRDAAHASYKRHTVIQ